MYRFCIRFINRASCPYPDRVTTYSSLDSVLKHMQAHTAAIKGNQFVREIHEATERALEWTTCSGARIRATIEEV